MSEAGWYFSDKGERRGPVDFSILKRMGEIGTINATTQVWRDGMDNWEPASRHLTGLQPPPLLAYSFSGQVDFTASGPRDYHERIRMGTAVARAFRGYFDFQGRANRGEFWWFVLANLVIGGLTGLADGMLGLAPMSGGPGPVNGLWTISVLIPSAALTARRLHDTGRSGWRQLLPLCVILLILPAIAMDSVELAVAGGILYLGLGVLLLIWLCQKGESVSNRFG